MKRSSLCFKSDALIISKILRNKGRSEKLTLHGFYFKFELEKKHSFVVTQAARNSISDYWWSLHKSEYLL